MTFKKVCIIGLKIIATAAAGIAVWISLNKSKLNNSKSEVEKEKKEMNKSSIDSNNLPAPSQSKGAEIVSSLRKFQDTCGKIFSVAQSLSVVGENLYRIFNGGQNHYQHNDRYYGSNPGFTRVTANIIEAGWNPNTSPVWGSQQSKFCF